MVRAQALPAALAALQGLAVPRALPSHRHRLAWEPTVQLAKGAALHLWHPVDKGVGNREEVGEVARENCRGGTGRGKNGDGRQEGCGCLQLSLHTLQREAPGGTAGSPVAMGLRSSRTYLRQWAAHHDARVSRGQGCWPQRCRNSRAGQLLQTGATSRCTQAWRASAGAPGRDVRTARPPARVHFVGGHRDDPPHAGKAQQRQGVVGLDLPGRSRRCCSSACWHMCCISACQAGTRLFGPLP